MQDERHGDGLKWVQSALALAAKDLLFEKYLCYGSLNL